MAKEHALVWESSKPTSPLYIGEPLNCNAELHYSTGTKLIFNNCVTTALAVKLMGRQGRLLQEYLSNRKPLCRVL